MNEKTTQAEPEYLTKITIKGIGVQPKGDLEGPKPLANIYGRCEGVGYGQSSFGEFVKLKGSYEAVNLATGEMFRSSTLMLPNGISEIVEDAVKKIQKDAKAGATVDFAFEIGVKPSDNRFGYEYTVRPLVDMVKSDELAGLRRIAGASAIKTAESAQAKTDNKKK